MAIISEYRTDGVELEGTMGKLLEVFDWDAVDVVGSQIAIRMLLLSCSVSTVEHASDVADAERELLAQFKSEFRSDVRPSATPDRYE